MPAAASPARYGAADPCRRPGDKGDLAREVGRTRGAVGIGHTRTVEHRLLACQSFRNEPVAPCEGARLPRTRTPLRSVFVACRARRSSSTDAAAVIAAPKRCCS